MIASNFYITAFVLLPISILFVVAGVVMVSSVQRESRVYFWIGPLVGANVSIQAGLSALRAFPALSEVQGALALIVVANLWAGTMLMLANAVRFEVNRRAARALNEHRGVIDRSNGEIPVA